MLISCSICKDIFFPSSEVCGTQCGHLYHESCLTKWQERSGSCPQCRTKLRNKPHRIYFVIEDSVESESELDAVALKEKLHHLREDLAETKRKYDQLEASYANAQKELVACSEKEALTEATVRALKQRIKELKKENEDIEQLRTANRSLRKKLKEMADLQTVLQGTQNEVCEMVKKTPVTPLAVHQLCVYVEALKNQLKVNEEKFKDENHRLSSQYKVAMQKLKRLLTENHSNKVQTSCKKQEKIENNTSLELKHSLKRPIGDISKSLPELENRPKCSSSSECETPVKKKQSAVVHKKVINNLDKDFKIDISCNSPDVEIALYPGPSKLLKLEMPREGSSIFNKFRTVEKDSAVMINRTDVTFDAWGRSTRNILAVSSSAEKTGVLKLLKKK